MRAVVYDRYGEPESCGSTTWSARYRKRTRSWCGSTPRRSPGPIVECGAHGPFFIRAFTGLRRPRQQVLGMELAGEVEAVGAAVTEFAVGDRVFGVKGSGAHAEFVCVRERGALAHMPSGMSFEEAAAVSDGVTLALACLRERGSARGEEHRRLRRIRRHRHCRGAARPVLRCSRHRRLQHEERRAREIARSGRGRRLHARRLHEERPDVRRHLRRGRQALVQALQALAEAGRPLRRDRPRVPVAGPVPRPADPVDRRQEGGDRRRPRTRRRTSSSSRSSSRRGSTGRSSTGVTRSRRWSTRRGTWRPSRRPETSF